MLIIFFDLRCWARGDWGAMRKVPVKSDAHFSCYKRELTYLETTLEEITAQLQNGTYFSIFFVSKTCVNLCVQAQHVSSYLEFLKF